MNMQACDDKVCLRDNLKNIFQIFLKLGWNILWVNISTSSMVGFTTHQIYA